MSNCNQMREFILDLFVGNLSDQHEQMVRDHIDSCSACREYHKHLFEKMGMVDRLSELVNRDMEDREKRAVKALLQLSSSVSPQVAIWRIIMHKKITKLAIAAVIILAAYLIIYQTGGPVGLTTVTFAQVQQAMNEVSWLQMIFTGEGRDEHDIDELWAGFETSVYASKRLDGYVRYIDLAKGEEYNYDPETNTIEISAVKTDEFEYDLSSSWIMLESMIGKLEDEGSGVEYSDGIFKGQHVNTITIKSDHEDSTCSCTVYIDPETHLVLAGKQRWRSKHDDEVVNTEICVVYPENGPADIYALGVPQNAEVLDNRN